MENFFLKNCVNKGDNTINSDKIEIIDESVEKN